MALLQNQQSYEHNQTKYNNNKIVRLREYYVIRCGVDLRQDFVRTIRPLYQWNVNFK